MFEFIKDYKTNTVTIMKKETTSKEYELVGVVDLDELKDLCNNFSLDILYCIDKKRR